MTHFTINLELDRDTKSSVIRKLLGSLEGVMKISISKNKGVKKSQEAKEMDQWIKDVKWLSENFDSSTLDMSDERTQYIMREQLLERPSAERRKRKEERIS